MFYDDVKVNLKAGNGGDGVLVFVAPNMSQKVDLTAAVVGAGGIYICKRIRMSLISLITILSLVGRPKMANPVADPISMEPMGRIWFCAYPLGRS